MAPPPHPPASPPAASGHSRLATTRPTVKAAPPAGPLPDFLEDGHKVEKWLSEEAQLARRQRLKLDTLEMLKFLEAQEFVSLGCFCGIARTLQAIGVKKFSYPFDWVRVPGDGVMHCLENQFEDFLTYTTVQQPANVQQPVYASTRWGGSFWHHDPGDAKAGRDFKRRAERLFGMGEVPAEKSRIFIRSVNNTRELALVETLLAKLKEILPESKVRLLVLVDFQEHAGPRTLGTSSSDDLLLYFIHEDIFSGTKDKPGCNWTMLGHCEAYSDAVAFACRFWNSDEETTKESSTFIKNFKSMHHLESSIVHWDGGCPQYEMFFPRRFKGGPRLVLGAADDEIWQEPLKSQSKTPQTSLASSPAPASRSRSGISASEPPVPVPSSSNTRTSLGQQLANPPQHVHTVYSKHRPQNNNSLGSAQGLALPVVSRDQQMHMQTTGSHTYPQLGSGSFNFRPTGSGNFMSLPSAAYPTASFQTVQSNSSHLSHTQTLSPKSRVMRGVSSRPHFPPQMPQYQGHYPQTTSPPAPVPTQSQTMQMVRSHPAPVKLTSMQPAQSAPFPPQAGQPAPQVVSLQLSSSQQSTANAVPPSASPPATAPGSSPNASAGAQPGASVRQGSGNITMVPTGSEGASSIGSAAADAAAGSSVKRQAQEQQPEPPQVLQHSRQQSLPQVPSAGQAKVDPISAIVEVAQHISKQGSLEVRVFGSLLRIVLPEGAEPGQKLQITNNSDGTISVGVYAR
eukprot:CAMPEP_0206517622 /NCGR_PEP_ID=MMETSP0324_2-20121206/64090_1 /ASSEMBLY_ACC=CAM_ASM_000836 /TAXON_ID=2866 /ORGANISM="Crypthecodinium cohnii, Strain Seligo" /LENGTH=736 /DNA_ID=CAMNT_0054010817 /DNA_START=31 /DNA_END=2241 /DNA_ORIENTATION=+